MSRWLERRRIRRALRQLPERDQAIFSNVRLEELDYVETAARHGVSVEEVERTVARVLYELTRTLNDRS